MTIKDRAIPLQTERAFFDDARRRWIAEGHEDQWAVVHGTDAVGFFDSFEEAYAAGFEAYGQTEFLVKQVTPADSVETTHRIAWGAAS